MKVCTKSGKGKIYFSGLKSRNKSIEWSKIKKTLEIEDFFITQITKKCLYNQIYRFHQCQMKKYRILTPINKYYN